MRTRTHILTVQAAAALIAALTLSPTTSATPAGFAYAVTGGRVHTVSGEPIDNGTVIIRDGVIEAVGAGLAAPADAVVVDVNGMNVYPGLIDMENDAPIEPADDAAANQGGGGGRGGRGGGAGAQQFPTREEAERAKRAAILQPNRSAARHLRTESDEQRQLASAGITTVLAIPPDGIFRGQSALVNVLVAPDDPQISEIADYRKGLAVVRSPVASHINMAGRGGGQGYPQSLLGTIAFTRQELANAVWQRDAEAAFAKNGGRGQRPLIEPALDALQPVLARQLPAAFDAGEAREIDRALAMAAEFNLDPIIVGGQGAAKRTAELLGAKARVFLSLNLPGAGGGRGGRGGGGGGGRGGGGAQSLSALTQAQDAPKVPAALAAAGVPFAFASDGLQNPADFVRNAGRIVSDGGLPMAAALRALTLDAARLAGADGQVGSIEKGKIANLVVAEGDLLSGGRVRHVFIDGRPIDIVAPAPATGRGGRGGGSR
jgi:imidazolonepropionase-like amidohydrolase